MGRVITVEEASHLLGVTVYRIHQLIREPCLKCGWVERVPGVPRPLEVFHFREGGCEWCQGSGRRLPTLGKLGGKKTSPYVLDMDVVLKTKALGRRRKT